MVPPVLTTLLSASAASPVHAEQYLRVNMTGVPRRREAEGA